MCRVYREGFEELKLVVMVMPSVNVNNDKSLKIASSETLESVFYFGLCCIALKDCNSLTRGRTLALAVKALSPNHRIPRNSLESVFSTRKRLRQRRVLCAQTEELPAGLVASRVPAGLAK